MLKTEALQNKRNWLVEGKIDKYMSAEDFAKGKVADIHTFKNNLLLAEGINEIWALVSGNDRPTGGAPRFFNARNSCIGVGSAGLRGDQELGATGVPHPQQPEQENTGLYGPCRVYLHMDEEYPKVGDMKIIFRSTFQPGIACFTWLEWTIANGNGNPEFTLPAQAATHGWSEDLWVPYDQLTDATVDGVNRINRQAEVRWDEWGLDPAPDPLPTVGGRIGGSISQTTDILFQNGLPPHSINAGIGEDLAINMNLKQENMGRKFAPAIWVFTIEVSLR